MRTTELLEADFGNFGTESAQAIDSITKHAGAAFNKLRGSYQKAASDVKSEKEKQQAEAEKEADKAKAEAEKQTARSKQLSGKQLQLKIPRLVAKLCLDRTPETPDDIEELQNLEAEQFNMVYTAIDKATERLSKFPAAMKSALSQSDFLQAQHRTSDELQTLLGDQDAKGFDPAEDMLMKNLYDEQAAWSDVLTIGDSSSVQQMLELMKAISRDFEKRNLAATGAGGRKAFPEGTGIVKIISTQRQIIQKRLELLHRAVEKLASNPITEETLHRLRGLLATL